MVGVNAIVEYNRNAEDEAKIDHLLVHIGQHYDDKMSKAFFEALDCSAAETLRPLPVFHQPG